MVFARRARIYWILFFVTAVIFYHAYQFITEIQIDEKQINDKQAQVR